MSISNFVSLIGDDIKRLNAAVKSFRDSQGVGGMSTEMLSTEEFAEAQAMVRKANYLAASDKKWAVALEKNVIYLEDLFEKEERKKIESGYYLTHEPTAEQETHEVKIDALFATIPDGYVIRARPGSVFSLRKHKGYRPDIYGTDGRRVIQRLSAAAEYVDPETKVKGVPKLPNGEVDYSKLPPYAYLQIDNAAPALSLLDKHNLRLEFGGAQFIVEEFGITGMYIGSPTGNSGGHHLNLGTWRTRHYMKVGYTSGWKNCFMPPIDGWTEEQPFNASGYSTKGYYLQGFSTADFAVDLSRFDNNSCRFDLYKPDLARLKKMYYDNPAQYRLESLGGYRESLDDAQPGFWIHHFPQFDGTVKHDSVGTWNGLQYGGGGTNNAICILGDQGSTIVDFDIRGFAGCAIAYGKLATWTGEDVGRGNVAAAKAAGIVAENQQILGGRFTHNYVGGVNILRCQGLYCVFLKNEGIVGHPQWSPQHSRDGADQTIDPGYGFCTGRSLPCTDLTVMHCDFGICARKCMDAHAGSRIKYNYNRGYAGFYAVSIAVEDTLSVGANNRTQEETTHKYQDAVFEISHNTWYSAKFGIHLNNGGLGPDTDEGNKRRRNVQLTFAEEANKNVMALKPLWWNRFNFRLIGNNIYAPVAINWNYGYGGFTIKDNDLVYARPFGPAYADSVSSVAVVNGGTGYDVGDVIEVHGGNAETSRGATGFVTAVSATGAITAINVPAGGDYYGDCKVRVISVNGKGAAFNVNIRNNNAVAIYFGAIKARGKSFGDIISGNRIRNSPDGNYGTALSLNTLTGATVSDNKIDVTPYATVQYGESSWMAYKSVNAFRSGLETTPFRHYNTYGDGGPITYTEWTGNFWYNQMTMACGMVKEPTENANSKENDSPPQLDWKGKNASTPVNDLNYVINGRKLWSNPSYVEQYSKPPLSPVRMPTLMEGAEIIRFSLKNKNFTNAYYSDDGVYPIVEAKPMDIRHQPQANWKGVNIATRTFHTTKTVGSVMAGVKLYVPFGTTDKISSMTFKIKIVSPPNVKAAAISLVGAGNVSAMLIGNVAGGGGAFVDGTTQYFKPHKSLVDAGCYINGVKVTADTRVNIGEWYTVALTGNFTDGNVSLAHEDFMGTPISEAGISLGAPSNLNNGVTAEFQDITVYKYKQLTDTSMKKLTKDLAAAPEFVDTNPVVTRTSDTMMMFSTSTHGVSPLAVPVPNKTVIPTQTLTMNTVQSRTAVTRGKTFEEIEKVLGSKVNDDGLKALYGGTVGEVKPATVPARKLSEITGKFVFEFKTDSVVRQSGRNFDSVLSSESGSRKMELIPVSGLTANEINGIPVASEMTKEHYLDLTEGKGFAKVLKVPNATKGTGLVVRGFSADTNTATGNYVTIVMPVLITNLPGNRPSAVWCAGIKTTVGADVGAEQPTATSNTLSKMSVVLNRENPRSTEFVRITGPQNHLAFVDGARINADTQISGGAWHVVVFRGRLDNTNAFIIGTTYNYNGSVEMSLGSGFTVFEGTMLSDDEVVEYTKQLTTTYPDYQNVTVA